MSAQLALDPATVQHPPPALDPAPQWLVPEPVPTVEAIRLHRKQRLAASFRIFASLGLDYGVPGHITARDPEWPDHFWVNPFGVYFGHIRVSDLLLVNDRGEVVQGARPVNRAAFAIHSQIHKARPDVIAAAHSHALHGKAWSTLGRLLDPLTQDACAFYQDHALFDDYTGVVLDTGEGERIAATLGSRKAVILRNHGFLTVGRSVEEAALWFITMENAAHAQLLAEAAGTPKPLSHDVASHTAQQIGRSGLRGFQPYWDRILRLQPDFLE